MVKRSETINYKQSSSIIHQMLAGVTYSRKKGAGAYSKQQHVTHVHKKNEGAVEISFTMSGLIARHSKPSLEGEFVVE